MGSGEQRSISSDADAVCCNVLSREAEVKPWRSGNFLYGSTRRRIWTQSKQQYWNTTSQDSEWCRYVRLSATRLQGYDALKCVWKEKGKGKRKGKEENKRKGKEKGKSKVKSKKGTSDTSNTKCSLCKGKDCPKSLRWPAEKRTMSYELCKLTMIDSDASVHVCPPKHGQGDGFRNSSETRPLPGAEMQQRRMRQMSYDSEAGRVTAVYRVLDMRRPIWSLGSTMDSGCDVYFTKDRCWIAKNIGKELDMTLSGGVFFVAAKHSKLLSRKRSALELKSMSPAEVERATSSRMHAGFGVRDSAARDMLDGDELPVRIRIPTGPVTPSAVERTLHKASGHALYRRWCRWCAAARAARETAFVGTAA